jgi:PII-like signaling protein
VNEDCLKLTSYFGERDRAGEELVADALLDIYGRHQLQTSILLRGVEGFGAHHRLRTDRLLTLSEDLPVVSVAVDTRERMGAVLQDVLAIKQRGLVTLERARMLTGELDRVELPEELHEATKLTLYIGRHERVAGRPAVQVVCDLLFERGLDGASVLLGVDGTAHGVRRRARFVGRNADVPAMIIAVGSGERIAEVVPELGALLGQPLATLERVRVCKRDGRRLARPPEVTPHDEQGLPVWQKLMVYSSERAMHGGSPIHVAIVRALRESGARGATCLRGMWGFHGGEPPHGDRLLQLRRRVPVVTVVVDSPHRIATWFDVIDEITADSGLVTSELVPAAVEPALTGPLPSVRLARPRRPGREPG